MPQPDLAARVHEMKAEMHELRSRVDVMTEQIRSLTSAVDKLVTRHEFDPIRLIVYGLVTCIFTGVIAAVLAKVFVK